MKNSISFRETLPKVGAVMGVVRMSAGGAKVRRVKGKHHFQTMCIHVVSVYMSM